MLRFVLFLSLCLSSAHATCVDAPDEQVKIQSGGNIISCNGTDLIESCGGGSSCCGHVQYGAAIRGLCPQTCNACDRKPPEQRLNATYQQRTLDSSYQGKFYRTKMEYITVDFPEDVYLQASICPNWAPLANDIDCNECPYDEAAWDPAKFCSHPNDPRCGTQSPCKMYHEARETCEAKINEVAERFGSRKLCCPSGMHGTMIMFAGNTQKFFCRAHDQTTRTETFVPAEDNWPKRELMLYADFWKQAAPGGRLAGQASQLDTALAISFDGRCLSQKAFDAQLDQSKSRMVGVQGGTAGTERDCAAETAGTGRRFNGAKMVLEGKESLLVAPFLENAMQKYIKWFPDADEVAPQRMFTLFDGAEMREGSSECGLWVQTEATSDWEQLVAVDGVDVACLLTANPYSSGPDLALNIMKALEGASGAAPAGGSQVSYDAMDEDGNKHTRTAAMTYAKYRALKAALDSDEESQLGGSTRVCQTPVPQGTFATTCERSIDPNAPPRPNAGKDADFASLDPKKFVIAYYAGVTDLETGEVVTKRPAEHGGEVIQNLKYPPNLGNEGCQVLVHGVYDASGNSSSFALQMKRRTPTCDNAKMAAVKAEMDATLESMRKQEIAASWRTVLPQTATDAWLDCAALVTDSLKYNQDTVSINSAGCFYTPPWETGMCTETGESIEQFCAKFPNDPWCRSPCCNHEKQRTQCCLATPKQVVRSTPAVDESKIIDTCPAVIPSRGPLNGTDTYSSGTEEVSRVMTYMREYSETTTNPEKCFFDRTSDIAKLKELDKEASCCYKSVAGDTASSWKATSIQMCAEDADCYSGKCNLPTTQSTSAAAAVPASTSACFTSEQTDGKPYKCAVNSGEEAAVGVAKCLIDRLPSVHPKALNLVKDLYGDGSSSTPEQVADGLKDSMYSFDCVGETGWKYSPETYYIHDKNGTMVEKDCQGDGCAGPCVSETKCNWNDRVAAGTGAGQCNDASATSDLCVIEYPWGGRGLATSPGKCMLNSPREHYNVLATDIDTIMPAGSCGSGTRKAVFDGHAYTVYCEPQGHTAGSNCYGGCPADETYFCKKATDAEGKCPAGWAVEYDYSIDVPWYMDRPKYCRQQWHHVYVQQTLGGWEKYEQLKHQYQQNPGVNTTDPDAPGNYYQDYPTLPAAQAACPVGSRPTMRRDPSSEDGKSYGRCHQDFCLDLQTNKQDCEQVSQEIHSSTIEFESDSSGSVQMRVHNAQWIAGWNNGSGACSYEAEEGWDFEGDQGASSALCASITASSTAASPARSTTEYAGRSTQKGRFDTQAKCEADYCNLAGAWSELDSATCSSLPGSCNREKCDGCRADWDKMNKIRKENAGVSEDQLPFRERLCYFATTNRSQCEGKPFQKDSSSMPVSGKFHSSGEFCELTNVGRTQCEDLQAAGISPEWVNNCEHFTGFDCRSAASLGSAAILQSKAKTAVAAYMLCGFTRDARCKTVSDCTSGGECFGQNQNIRGQYCFDTGSGNYECNAFEKICLKPRVATPGRTYDIGCGAYEKAGVDVHSGRVHYQGSDKCIDLYEETEASCTTSGGTWISTLMWAEKCAETGTRCSDEYHSERQGEQCTLCGGRLEPLATWSGNKWLQPAMVSRTAPGSFERYKWEPRAMQPVNQWKSVLNEWKLRLALKIFKDQLLVEVEGAFSNCIYGGQSLALSQVADVCDPPTTGGRRTGSADAKYLIASETVFAGASETVGNSQTSNVAIDAQVLADNTLVSIYQSPYLPLGSGNINATAFVEGTEFDASCYTVVTNKDDVTVGQLVGDCVKVEASTIAGTTAPVPLGNFTVTVNKTVTLCIGTNDYVRRNPDFTMMDFTGRQGANPSDYSYSPVELAVTQTGNKFCGQISEPGWYCPAMRLMDSSTRTSTTYASNCPAIDNLVVRAQYAQSCAAGDNGACEALNLINSLKLHTCNEAKAYWDTNCCSQEDKALPLITLGFATANKNPASCFALQDAYQADCQQFCSARNGTTNGTTRL